jgi:hypothetical protein
MPGTKLPALATVLPALALLAFAQPASATCTAGTDAEGNPTFTCDGPVTTRQNRSTAGEIITITPDGSIDVPNNRALNLSGADQTVINEGLLRGGGDNDAIRTNASGLTVDNIGEIIASDRGIRLTGPSSSFTLFNREGALISARRQAVRLDQEVLPENNRIENWGTIESAEGRAIQSRGANTTVINHETGVLRGAEEVIEGRLDFTLENRGFIGIIGLSWDPVTRTWANDGAPTSEEEGEDGVQFSSGRVDNWGVILATDDGIDIDQGVVHNHATGVIVSAGDDDIRDAGAVDIDEVLQIPLPGGNETFEAPGKVTIINEGYMEGPRAIVADLDAPQTIDITNTGTLFGRSGIAIDLAPGQGDTSIALSGGSRVLGDILFGGGGTNTLVLGPFETGATMQGTISAQMAPVAVASLSGMLGGGLGAFDVLFDAELGLADFLRFLHRGERFLLDLRAGSGEIRFDLLGVNSFTLEGERYDPAAFAAFLSSNGVAVIPLPAAGWLLLGGLGALALLRRRRAA